MHIYLVRHTEYLNPENVYTFHLPFYLSEYGRAQAQKVGTWFTEHKLLNIPVYSSPIVRALQTAEIIANKTNSFVTVDSRLEETSCKNLQGQKQPEKDDWKVEEDDPSRETHSAILKRMISIYTEKVNTNTDCIFISHGDPLTVLYYHLLQKEPPRYLWDPNNFDLVVQRGEIVDIKVINGEFNSITRINV